MKIDTTELYAQRTLVFIEIEPQSNQYRQVLVEAEQYKELTKLISTYKRKTLNNNIEEVEVDLSEQVYTLPDLHDIFEK